MHMCAYGIHVHVIANIQNKSRYLLVMISHRESIVAILVGPLSHQELSLSTILNKCVYKITPYEMCGHVISCNIMRWPHAH